MYSTPTSDSKRGNQPQSSPRADKEKSKVDLVESYSELVRRRLSSESVDVAPPNPLGSEEKKTRTPTRQTSGNFSQYYSKENISGKKKSHNDDSSSTNSRGSRRSSKNETQQQRDTSPPSISDDKLYPERDTLWTYADENVEHETGMVGMTRRPVTDETAIANPKFKSLTKSEAESLNKNYAEDADVSPSINPMFKSDSTTNTPGDQSPSEPQKRSPFSSTFTSFRSTIAGPLFRGFSQKTVSSTGSNRDAASPDVSSPDKPPRPTSIRPIRPIEGLALDSPSVVSDVVSSVSGIDEDDEGPMEALPYKRSKPSTFVPTVGPAETKPSKASKMATSPANKKTPTKIQTENEKKGFRGSGLFQVLSSVVSFEGGFSTVYSADSPKQSIREPQLKPDLDGEQKDSSNSQPSHRPRLNTKLSSNSDNNFIRSNLTSFSPNSVKAGSPVYDEAIKAMGLTAGQEGGMDYESALLIVLMDPKHPYGQFFNPTAKFENVYDSALHANEKELDRMVAELSDDHPDVISLKQATSDLYKGLDMPIAAEVLLRQVIDSQKRVNGPEAFEVISSMNDLGLLLLAMHRYAEAQKVFEEVVTSVCKTHGETHPDAAAALGNLAIALRYQSIFATAVPVHEHAISILEQPNGAGRDYPETCYQRAQMGITLMQMGVEQKGKRYVNEAITQLKEKSHLPPLHPWILTLAAAVEE